MVCVIAMSYCDVIWEEYLNVSVDYGYIVVED